jgi:hypothetical protein
MVLLACGSQIEEEPPLDILDREKFVLVMTDVQLLEAIRKQKMIREDDPTAKLASWYKEVFEKHGISENQFTATFTWYYGHPEEMILIYEEVFEQLSLLEGNEPDQ